MKKSISAFLCVALMMLGILSGLAFLPAEAYAATELTFTGKVTDKTTSDTLYLSTSGGTVQIKIDSNTDCSEARFLFSGTKVTVDCYRGDDEYWHASKVSSEKKAENATVDNSNQATVTGRIEKDTTSKLIYLDVPNGTMEIKVDATTEFSGIKYLTVGKKVQIVVARGSDAYMHAVSITEPGGKPNYSNGNSNVSGTGVTGKVDSKTTASILYLKTKDGTMEFVLDLGTDASECRVLMPDESITVYFYRGDDAWNHASKIVNNSSSCSSEVSKDSNSKITATGTVGSDTSESTLYLKTSGGTMQIKLDASTNFSNCPVILKGKSIKVECERGSDEYYHATNITPN